MAELLKTIALTDYQGLKGAKPELWQPEYGEYSLKKQIQRLDAIGFYLLPEYRGDKTFEDAWGQTRQIIEHHFDVYEGRQAVEIPGSFAFVVPTRIERKPPGSNDEYSTETDSLFPMLRYGDTSSKQVFMAGMCPFVIDRYHTGPDGKAGAEVYAPVLSDIGKDSGDLVKAFTKITKIMNQTTDFCVERLGVDVASFAAMLPRLTNYGQTIETSVVTTTGHGATVALVAEALIQARDRHLTRQGTLDKIGIVGTGAIGAAAAELLLETGLTNNIVMSDVRPERGENVIKKLQEKYPYAKLVFTQNNIDSINGCNATIGAAAARFDLNSPEWQGAEIDGAWIVDDSQPGAFPLQQVEERGGHVVWPIGIDKTKYGLGTLLSFEYGEREALRTGPAARNELFGCEAEVVAISATREFEQAIRSEVTSGQVIAIRSLMGEVGIDIAETQCLGRYINT